MKFRTLCYQCYPAKSTVDFDMSISISETDLYEYRCSLGHVTLLELQVFKFEILFESGLCAIRDKYFMESILSITAALERFYEFFIKIILKKQNISEELIEKSFKTMSRQSERQVGAFTVLYLSTFLELPKMLKQKMITFRNDVVHKGYLPNENETLEYAEEVYNTIKPIYLKLLEDYSRTIMNYQLDIKKGRREKYKDIIKKNNNPILGIAPDLTLTHVLNIDSFRNRTFQESFQTLTKNGVYM